MTYLQQYTPEDLMKASRLHTKDNPQWALHLHSLAKAYFERIDTKISCEMHFGLDNVLANVNAYVSFIMVLDQRLIYL